MPQAAEASASSAPAQTWMPQPVRTPPPAELSFPPAPQQSYQPEPAYEPQPPPAQHDPEPLAGPNVMNVVMVGAECAPWSKTGAPLPPPAMCESACSKPAHSACAAAPRSEWTAWQLASTLQNSTPVMSVLLLLLLTRSTCCMSRWHTLLASGAGGLGDVMGALPKALARRGHRTMVVAPRYSNYAEGWETGVRVGMRVMSSDVEIGYFHGYIDGVDYVFVDHPCFHGRQDNIYGGDRGEVRSALQN